MTAKNPEAVFDEHRLIKDYEKMTESDRKLRYTLFTTIEKYNEWMLDYDWLEVIEVVSDRCQVKDFADYDGGERGRLARFLLGPSEGEEWRDSLTFVVEVEQ